MGTPFPTVPQGGGQEGKPCVGSASRRKVQGGRVQGSEPQCVGVFLPEANHHTGGLSCTELYPGDVSPGEEKEQGRKKRER